MREVVSFEIDFGVAVEVDVEVAVDMVHSLD
jgi:hypothetical protein